MRKFIAALQVRGTGSQKVGEKNARGENETFFIISGDRRRLIVVARSADSTL